MAFAVIWHYWLGVIFTIVAVVLVVAVVIGYLVKVESLKYPKR